jgi:hypothetical protein
MQGLWESNLELVVESGFIYLPLLFDHTVARELQALYRFPPEPPEAQGRPAPPVLLEVAGQHFVKSLRLDALLQNYEKIDPEGYERLRGAYLPESGPAASFPGESLDEKLRVIIFQIMPHFLRREKVWARGEFGREAVLDLLCERVAIPPSFYARWRDLLDPASLQARLASLEGQTPPWEPPNPGLSSARKLRPWFTKALLAQMAAKEKERLARTLKEQQQFGEVRPQHLAVLLYLTERGALELDGFGFSRIAGTAEYLIYKRTGAYALKDFYGRLYLFPDCRVAVYTWGGMMPVVLEKYKHPLLFWHSPGQQICLPRSFTATSRLSGENVIRALEAGVNALYYGYNARRRNGSHSLDSLRKERPVDFDDYRVPPDHPLIVSGQVEIKNLFT